MGDYQAHTENFISRSHPGLAKDWFITALASGNFRAEEPEDDRPYTQTLFVVGRDGNSKSWRSTRKRSNRLLCKVSKHSALPRSRDRHHQKTGHLGQEYVLSILRHQYWVIKGRSAVRRVISGCFLCKKLGAVRGEQLMGDLPKERLMSEEPPFTHVGVDYFGPIYVRQGRSNVKRYGCLFTCLAVRAVHIEVVHSLDTDGFINALRRFVSLRGCPTTIISDNGTNFRAGEKELRESLSEWNQTTIYDFLRQKKIIWKFNPPGASHMGGAWERIIRSIRKILKALLGQQLVTDEMLQTLMAEVAGILNSRPLTPVSSDPKDLEPLTLNHLLSLRSNPRLLVGSFGKEDSYSKRRHILEPLGERLSAEREVAASNPGRTNSQGL